MNLQKSVAKAFKQMSMLGLMRVMAEERSVNELVTSVTAGPAPNGFEPYGPGEGAFDGDWLTFSETTEPAIYD